MYRERESAARIATERQANVPDEEREVCMAFVMFRQLFIIMDYKAHFISLWFHNFGMK